MGTVRGTKSILVWLTVVALLLPPKLAFAGPTRNAPDTVTPQQATEMRVLLRVHTLMYQMERELIDAEANGQLNQGRLGTILQNYTGQVIESYRDPHNSRWIDLIKPWVLGKIAFHAVAEHVLGVGRKVVDTHRTHGLLPAALVAIGGIADIAVPLALAKFGASETVVGLAAGTPLVILLPGAYLTARKLREDRRVHRAYDPEVREERKAVVEMVRKELRLDAMTDALVPLLSDEDHRKTVAVSEPNRFWRALEKIGRVEKTANYESLRALILEFRKNDRFVSMLDRDDKMDKLTKAAMLANYLVGEPDAKLREEFEKRFSHKIQTSPKRVAIEPLEGWAMEVANAENFEELTEWLKLVPSGTNARWVARLWKEVLVPELLNGPLGRVDAERLRRMRDEATDILIETEHAADPTWNSKWEDRFTETITRPVYHNWCQRRLADLGKFASMARGWARR